MLNIEFCPLSAFTSCKATLRKMLNDKQLCAQAAVSSMDKDYIGWALRAMMCSGLRD